MPGVCLLPIEQVDTSQDFFNERVLSGPFLVSRTGDAGWTERLV